MYVIIWWWCTLEDILDTPLLYVINSKIKKVLKCKWLNIFKFIYWYNYINFNFICINYVVFYTSIFVNDMQDIALCYLHGSLAVWPSMWKELKHKSAFAVSIYRHIALTLYSKCCTRKKTQYKCHWKEHTLFQPNFQFEEKSVSFKINVYCIA
jgi:hypothetical protein